MSETDISDRVSRNTLGVENILGEGLERHYSYIPRLSTSNESITEDQIRNNDIFSPRPVVERASRRSIAERQSSIVQSDLEGEQYNQAYPFVFKTLCSLNKFKRILGDSDTEEDDEANIDYWFDCDETCGYSDDKLFDMSMDLLDIFSSVKNVLKTLPTPPANINTLLLPPKMPGAPSHTLVLDLDETLVHCSLEKPDHYDAICQSKEYCSETNSLNDIFIYIRFRPYVFHFLEEMSRYYEIVVFTAAQPTYALFMQFRNRYANKLIELFNEKKTVIQYCLTREHTTFINETEYFKDLSRLNRDLKKTFIIDNTPLVYCYNVNNAIPIQSWYGDEDDKELFILMDYLRSLSKIDDVRTILKDTFQIENLLQNKTISTNTKI